MITFEEALTHQSEELRECAANLEKRSRRVWLRIKTDDYECFEVIGFLPVDSRVDRFFLLCRINENEEEEEDQQYAYYSYTFVLYGDDEIFFDAPGVREANKKVKKALSRFSESLHTLGGSLYTCDD